jgi:hypothetical protein
VYTPADGRVPTKLDVYEFDGKGVAMSMYNTDEVGPNRSPTIIEGLRYFVVDIRLRTFVVQDGFD